MANINNSREMKVFRETLNRVYEGIRAGKFSVLGDPLRVSVKHIKYYNPNPPLTSVEVHRDSLSGKKCKDGYVGIVYEAKAGGKPGWSKKTKADIIIIENEDLDLIFIKNSTYQEAFKNWKKHLKEFGHGPYGVAQSAPEIDTENEAYNYLIPISYFDKSGIKLYKFKKPVKPAEPAPIDLSQNRLF